MCVEDTGDTHTVALDTRYDGRVVVFEKPTLEEVEKYIAENKLQVNAQQFWGYYNAREWKDANGKLVDYWMSKIQQWHYNDAQKALASNSASTKLQSAKQRGSDNLRAVMTELANDGGEK